MKIYNTLTRKEEKFKPLKGKTVLFYTCGPTVYDFAHIGNLATFVRQDLLKRFLEYLGYKVKHVMNITDIDDKTIKRSGEMGITLKQLTDHYLKEFLKDMKTLNIKKPTKLVRATREIPEMIKIIKALIRKGYAYEKFGSVYFSIKKFKGYGKLSKIDLRGIKPGARVDVDEYAKEEPVDFALWKKATLEELKRGIYFESPWGKGRPGWHIECSAIALKYLGKTIDIHSGGIDLIFPHHENEIAQSEAYTGKTFARYWVHCEHLLVEGKKMSKSLGNFYTLRDLLAKGCNPKAIRFLFLSGHYRKQLNFTFERIKQAEKSIETIVNFLRRLKEVEQKGFDEKIDEKLEEMKEKFIEALKDDLNTPEALAVLFEFIHEMNKLIDKNLMSKRNARKILRTILDLDRILGLNLKEEIKGEKVPKEILRMLEEREKLRKQKRFAEADAIREKIRELGWEVEDTPEGPKVRKRI
jgi:cysteinyl-tRNA synthetase